MSKKVKMIDDGEEDLAIKEGILTCLEDLMNKNKTNVNCHGPIMISGKTAEADMQFSNTGSFIPVMMEITIYCTKKANYEGKN